MLDIDMGEHMLRLSDEWSKLMRKEKAYSACLFDGVLGMLNDLTIPQEVRDRINVLLVQAQAVAKSTE